VALFADGSLNGDDVKANSLTGDDKDDVDAKRAELEESSKAEEPVEGEVVGQPRN
jgi:hypothetical protein